MKNVLKLSLVVALFMATTVVWSAPQIKIATGAKGKTYSRMTAEATAVCGTQLLLNEVNSAGSLDNINKLLANEVNAGIVQTDVLYYRAKTDDLSKIMTLVALHPEEVHFITTTAGFKEGGTVAKMTGFGGNVFTPKTVADLKGKVVGASGGSFITANVISAQSGLNYQVREFGNDNDALVALKKGEIHAVVSVGGAPIGILDKVGQDMRLLPVTPQIIEALTKVYRPAKVSYNKMFNSLGVQTIATDALLVTREYKTADMNGSLAAFRKCLIEALPGLQDTTGLHPKWMSVDPMNKGKWVYYNFPGQAAPAKVTKKK